MRSRALAGVAIVASVIVTQAAPAPAAQPFTGSCSVAPSPNNPGFATLTVTGLPKVGPGKIVEADPVGPGPTNPQSMPFVGAGTQSSTFAYAVAGVYSFTFYLVNDKTGNGHGDGSGDNVTVLVTGLCPGALP